MDRIADVFAVATTSTRRPVERGGPVSGCSLGRSTGPLVETAAGIGPEIRVHLPIVGRMLRLGAA